MLRARKLAHVHADLSQDAFGTTARDRVGYWTRKAKGVTAANGASRPKAKRGRPAGSRSRLALLVDQRQGVE
jgi:hypothetical protein